MCVCAYYVGVHPEHNEGEFQPIMPLKFESIHAVQQRYSSSSSSSSSSSGATPPVNLAMLIHVGTPLFRLLTSRHPGDVKPTTSRRGTLYSRISLKTNIRHQTSPYHTAYSSTPRSHYGRLVMMLLCSLWTLDDAAIYAPPAVRSSAATCTRSSVLSIYQTQS